MIGKEKTSLQITISKKDLEHLNEVNKYLNQKRANKQTKSQLIISWIDSAYMDMKIDKAKRQALKNLCDKTNE